MKTQRTKTQSKITNLKDLKEALDAPLKIEFKLNGTDVALRVLRCSYAVDEQRRAVLRSVTPPFDKARGPVGDYDYMAATYRAACALAEDQARSLVVYHCCPDVAAEQPGLTDPAQIHSFVKGQLPPPLLEMISLTAMAGGVEVNERANFIYTPASES